VSRFRKYWRGVFAFGLLIGTPTFGATFLPYSTRTRAYSGYSSTIRGDNETIGMAGATVAVPDSISSLEANPAGLTMTMGSVTAQLNSNAMKDRTVSGEGQPKIISNQWGLSVTPNDWGYSIAYYTPSFEGGNYTSASTGRESAYEVSLKQLRLSVSHAVFDGRLSIGVAGVVNHAVRGIGNESNSANELSYLVGAIYHVRDHFLLGASFTPPQEIGASVFSSGIPELPGFAEPIRTPSLLNVGVGWIPNRFFDAGAAIVAVGSTRDTALLRDQSVTIGDGFTLQPRVGVSYILAQYRALKVSVAGGAYYETSRIEGVPNRLHFTNALQVNPYFVNLGLGVDRATNFDNFFVSVGFDIVRLIRTLRIIPRDPVPPYNAFWPKPFAVQSDGLPDGVTTGEKRKYTSPSAADVEKIVNDIPTNIGNMFRGVFPADEPALLDQPPLPPAEPKRRRKKYSAPGKPPIPD
jgi:hypothetical protein